MVLDPGVLGYLEPMGTGTILATKSRGSVRYTLFQAPELGWARLEVLTHDACSPTEREGSAALCWSQQNLLFF